MNLLEIIGVLTILTLLILAVKYYYNYKINLDKRITEKRDILINFHPEISVTFSKYLKAEQERISKSYDRNSNDSEFSDYDDGYRGTTKIIFGKKYDIYNPHIEIEEKIKKRIKELEKNPDEIIKINEVVSIAKEVNNRYILRVQLELITLKQRYFEHKDLLNSIFINDQKGLSEKEIISKIEWHFRFTHIKSNDLLIELSTNPNQILLKQKETGKYFYWERGILDRIKELQDRIENEIYKYH